MIYPKKGDKVPEQSTEKTSETPPPDLKIKKKENDKVPTLTSKMQGSSGWAPHNETAHLLPVQSVDLYNQELTGDKHTPIRTAGGHGAPAVAVSAQIPAVDAGYVIPIDTRNALRDPEKKDEVNRQGCGVGEAGDPAPTLTDAFTPAIAVRTAQTGANGIGVADDVAHTLDAAQGQAVAYATKTPTINMQGSKGNAVAQEDDPSYTLNAMHGHAVHAVAVPKDKEPVAVAENQRGEIREMDKAPSLSAGGGKPRSGYPTVMVSKEAPPEAMAIQAGAAKENPDIGPDGVGVRTDGKAYTIEARAEVQAVLAFKPGQSAESRSLGVAVEVAPTIEAGGGGNNKSVVCYENHAQDSRITETGNIAPQLNAKASTGGNNLPLVGVPEDPVAFQAAEARRTGTIKEQSVVPSLTSQTKRGDTEPLVRNTLQVRRLTPKECERLQGFPDEWTKISWKGKPAAQCPDRNRYCALGNSMATPVITWIGERIVWAEKMAAGEQKSPA